MVLNSLDFFSSCEKKKFGTRGTRSGTQLVLVSLLIVNAGLVVLDFSYTTTRKIIF